MDSLTVFGGGRLTRLENKKSGGTVISTFDYLYDNAGNRTKVTENDGSVVEFVHDATYRLTKEKRSTTNTYWYEYLYDNGGNRTKFIQKDSMGNQTGSKGYAYDAANKLTLEGDLSSPSANGNIQYTYDSNGNTTKKAIVGDGNTFYYYDADNHITKLNDRTTLTFTYMGDGARFSWSDGTTTTKSVYDRKAGTPGLDPVLLETDNGGTTTATYTHGLGLVSQKRSSTTYYYHFEAIGTTRQLTNSTETVTDTYVFDAWGNQLNSAQPTTNPYQYIGRQNYYLDGQSGLILLGVRYYDASTGKFVTLDPIREGSNWYRYADENPVGILDPSGLASQKPHCDILMQMTQNDRQWCKNKTIRGYTTCIIATGNIERDTCTDKCFKPCVREHEDVHVKHRKDCCALLKKCLTQPKITEKGKDECCKKYLDWLTDTSDYSECEAAKQGEKCAKRYWQQWRCDYACLPGGPSDCCRDMKDYENSQRGRQSARCPGTWRDCPFRSKK